MGSSLSSCQKDLGQNPKREKKEVPARKILPRWTTFSLPLMPPKWWQSPKTSSFDYVLELGSNMSGDSPVETLTTRTGNDEVNLDDYLKYLNVDTPDQQQYVPYN